MRLKKYALSLFAMGLLFSCSNNNTTDNKTTNENKTIEKTEDSSKDTVINYLDFIKNDRNFRVDFMDDDTGLVLKYGDANVESKKDTALDVSKQFSCSGTFTDKINLVIVRELVKAGDESASSYSVSVNAGISYKEIDESDESNKFIEYLNSKFNLISKNSNKLYVAVSKGSEVKWTKNLNKSMDAKIQTYIN